MRDDERWSALLARDTRQDGQFFYAVATTGIYCRPSCPSRKPHREAVVFFATAPMAEQAGYRACKRCRPGEISAPAEAVCCAIEYLRAHVDSTVTLATLAKVCGMSPFHLQRVFKRITGVTPRQFQQGERMQRFRQELRNRDSNSVTEAIYASGFGSSSRAYEGAQEKLGMTPLKYRRGGEGMTVQFATFTSELGEMLIAATTKGVCSLQFGGDADLLKTSLRQEFPQAALVEDPAGLKAFAETVERALSGPGALGPGTLDLPLDVRATAYQQRVWEMLRTIPKGETRSYEQIATALGNPAGCRAVARACASNPVALAIPCHRVVAKSGALAGYRWGVERKRALLERERKSAARAILV